MEIYNNPQEEFWAGEFGDQYLIRNKITPDILSSRIANWAKMLKNINPKPKTILELGCNIGANLLALKTLLPNVNIEAVEINKKAADIASKTGCKIYNTSILNFKSNTKYDLCFTSGVLIHINPEVLNDVYQIIYNLSNSYIILSEYYNPTPIDVIYRGNKDKLFKRDFAGEMLDIYKNLLLLDYGFFYHRDELTKGDDATWFLLKK